jgi:hypothetical membrane protein
LAIVFVAFNFLSLRNIHLVPPRIQALPKPSVLVSLFPYAPEILEYSTNLSISFYLVGEILQLVMNFHSRSFAASYKTSTMLLTLKEMLKLAQVSPMLLGRSTKQGLSVAEGILAMVICAYFVQALRYRSVRLVEDDPSSD